MKNFLSRNNSLDKFINKINYYVSNNLKFFALIDFLGRNIIVEELNNLQNIPICYDFNGFTNFQYFESDLKKISIEKKPLSYEEYLKVFKKIQAKEEKGESYLINLTFATPIKINMTLKEIFNLSKAKFKILYDDYFVCFSPERFVKIVENKIYSYPMKGTRKIHTFDEAKYLTLDEKEKAEHVTIVDLIRNDIGIISTKVETTKFMYIDILQTNEGLIAQTSSEIVGHLPLDWKNNFGELLFSLLPAGSITGAPKKRTIEIILENENYNRGFYTGVAGIYDGANFDSCVLIRFIEKTNNGYLFKSGGGITIYSDPKKEYQELIDKIYAPIY